MVYENSTQLGAGFFLVFGVWSLVGLAVYVWYLWSLSRLFPYLGLPSGWGWIPLWNQWQLIQRGGLPGWLALFMIVPGLSIIVLVVSIIAIHRINTEFGKGAGFTVLGAFIPPLWATLFSAQLRDREFDAAGYAAAGYPAADGFGADGAGYAGAPAYGTAGFAPQRAAGQHDPSWQGLPPVPQQPAVAQDPWAAAPVAEPANGGWQQPAPPQPVQSQQPVQHQQPAQNQQTGSSAQQPVVNNWGFSNTTEGDFERLAAEGVAPRAPQPLGGETPPRPFSWPAVEDTNVEHESGPMVLPEPSAAVLSQAPESDQRAAPAPPPVPAHPPVSPGAEPLPTPAPEPAPEPSIFDRGAPAQPASEPVAQPAAEPAAPTPAASVAPPTAPVAASTAPATPAAAPIAAAPPVAPPVAAPGGLDEDHTVVVSRRSRWALELPGGELLELDGDDIVIGRKPEAREASSVLQITDPTRTTSKSHARLRRAGEDWSIEDLQSTNGVSLVGADGTATQLEPGRVAPVTEQMIIGTLEVRLRQL